MPPAVGFYAKLVVLQAAISAGYVWLAVVAVMFSLVGAFYYLRIIKVMYFNERPIGIELPTFVILKVTETTSAFKGDTVGGTKPATLETGAVVQVPFHIKEGDVLKIDTRDYSYAEKANK